MLITSDEPLRRTLGGKLAEWGLAVHHAEAEDLVSMPRVSAGVVLVDIRRRTGYVLERLATLLDERPEIEAILINRPDNIGGSRAGMKVGAGQELMVPFDMAALQSAVFGALAKGDCRTTNRISALMERFSRSMSAATFAEAGEFDTARGFLESDDTAERRPKSQKTMKNTKNQRDGGR